MPGWRVFENRTIPVRPAGSALTAMGSAPKG
jgi:hypothetical protein